MQIDAVFWRPTCAREQKFLVKKKERKYRSQNCITEI